MRNQPLTAVDWRSPAVARLAGTATTATRPMPGWRAIGRTVIETPSRAVEYAERGASEPLLAIHAIFGGCD